MNNSTLVHDSLSLEEPRIEERNVNLREKESELVRVITALEEVGQSAAWSSLKRDIFDNLKESLQKKIFQEATKEKPDVSILTSLRGEWKWVSRFADLSTYRDEKRLELNNVKKLLHDKE
jgi:hypothetical protein